MVWGLGIAAVGFRGGILQRPFLSKRTVVSICDSRFPSSPLIMRGTVFLLFRFRQDPNKKKGQKGTTVDDINPALSITRNIP